MAVDGAYQIEIDTPMGKQKASVIFKSSGSTLTGTADTPMGKKDFTGTVEGNNLSWQIEVSSPAGSMKLEFTGTVSGNEISGKAKAGMFGSFPFKGTRI